MEREIVRKRAWLAPGEFLDLVGAANLIPGPNSTEVALFVGLRRAGWRGLLVAGAGFILPAVLMVLGCAWAYQRWGGLPPVEGALRAMAPVVVALVAAAVWSFARVAVRRADLALLAAVAVAVRAMGIGEIPILLGAGVVALLADRLHRRGLSLPAADLASAAGLFLFFLKVGAFVYGSGYVLLAFLENGLVRTGWLTERQLLDALAIGQATPGPVFTTATFVGYVLAGVPGALAATLGIFLPALILVPLTAPVIPRLQGAPAARAFLDGVNIGAVALMVVVAVQLGRAALTGPGPVAVAAFALLLLLGGVNGMWLLGAAALLGTARVIG
jgi:chromate transporter